MHANVLGLSPAMRFVLCVLVGGCFGALASQQAAPPRHKSLRHSFDGADGTKHVIHVRTEFPEGLPRYQARYWTEPVSNQAGTDQNRGLVSGKIVNTGVFTGFPGALHRRQSPNEARSADSGKGKLSPKGSRAPSVGSEVERESVKGPNRASSVKNTEIDEFIYKVAKGTESSRDASIKKPVEAKVEDFIYKMAKGGASTQKRRSARSSERSLLSAEREQATEDWVRSVQQAASKNSVERTTKSTDTASVRARSDMKEIDEFIYRAAGGGSRMESAINDLIYNSAKTPASVKRSEAAKASVSTGKSVKGETIRSKASTEEVLERPSRQDSLKGHAVASRSTQTQESIIARAPSVAEVQADVSGGKTATGSLKTEAKKTAKSVLDPAETYLESEVANSVYDTARAPSSKRGSKAQASTNGPSASMLSSGRESGTDLGLSVRTETSSLNSHRSNYVQGPAEEYPNGSPSYHQVSIPTVCLMYEGGRCVHLQPVHPLTYLAGHKHRYSSESQQRPKKRKTGTSSKARETVQAGKIPESQEKGKKKSPSKEKGSAARLAEDALLREYLFQG